MSGELTPFALTSAAERIRKQIKEMIPGDSDEQKSGKAERLPTEIKGSVVYGGDPLAKRVSELISEMNIGKVCDVVSDFVASLTRRKWIWTVAHFHEAKEILNDSSQMYLIPLSEKLTLSRKTSDGATPKRVLEEGYCAFIRNHPIISAGASVIFITPPV